MLEFFLKKDEKIMKTYECDKRYEEQLYFKRAGLDENVLICFENKYYIEFKEKIKEELSK